MLGAKQSPLSPLLNHSPNSVPFITNMSSCLGSNAETQAIHVMEKNYLSMTQHVLSKIPKVGDLFCLVKFSHPCVSVLFLHCINTVYTVAHRNCSSMSCMSV